MYNKIFSGYQPRQMVEWRNGECFFSQFNHLTRLVAREDLIIKTNIGQVVVRM
jgi:hypothetical protein